MSSLHTIPALGNTTITTLDTLPLDTISKSAIIIIWKVYTSSRYYCYCKGAPPWVTYWHTIHIHMNVLSRIMCLLMWYVVIGCIHGRNWIRKCDQSTGIFWENRGARGSIAWFYHSRRVLRQTDEGPVCWFYQVLTFYMPLQRLSILACPLRLYSIFPYISCHKHGIFTLFVLFLLLGV